MRGETCSYTSARRKPGPPRGSQRNPPSPKRRRNSRKLTPFYGFCRSHIAQLLAEAWSVGADYYLILAQVHQRYGEFPEDLNDGVSLTESISERDESVLLEQPTLVESSRTPISPTQFSDQLGISAQQEEHLCVESAFDV